MSTHQVRWSRRFAAGRNLATAALFSGAALFLAPAVLAAQDVAGDLGFVLNTYSFLVWGVLVMWMCAGFTMLEAGSVRSKSASMICMKNIGLYAIAGLAYYVIGYNLMYVDVGSVIGSISLLYGPSAEEVALIEAVAADADVDAATAAVREAAGDNNYSVMSDWFFQMVFVATTASIVSGALAERVKLWTFFVFVGGLTAVIYPIVGAWTWGGGWLDQMGFSDFAGSTIVHSTGGWAALAGALVVGPRWGKYRKDGSIKPTPPSNIPAVTLGVFILWMGWFGFNGGSELALSGVVNAVSMSNILVNTNLAAAAGVITALCLSRSILGRVDLFATLNGAISGLVAITAGPNITNSLWAILIGAVGSLLCMFGLKLLEVRRIDDVVGAVPAHLFAGIWGTLATCIAAGGDFVPQLTGVAAVGVFVFSVSWIFWTVLDRTLGVRVSRSVESIGQDAAELGIDAYPEFVLMVDPDDDNDFRDAD